MPDRPDIAREAARLERASLNTLWREWRALWRSEPPRHIKHDFLIRGITYRLQERAEGGLTQATRRSLRSLAQRREGSKDDCPPLPLTLRPGVRLVRSWRGEVYEVLVQPAGFDYRGMQYRSLSQIAALITGAHWSGPRFFGIGRAEGPAARPSRRSNDHAPA